MRPRSRFLLALCLFAVLIMPPLAAGAKTQAVYTWVDKNGVRHYSDHPGGPNAKLLTLAAPEPMSASNPSPPPVPQSLTTRSSAPQAASAAHAAESPVARAARCKRLRDMVERLQSARRVRVNENGKSRYVSGEDLVKFKAQMTRRMQAACAPQADAAGA